MSPIRERQTEKEASDDYKWLKLLQLSNGIRVGKHVYIKATFLLLSEAPS